MFERTLEKPAKDYSPEQARAIMNADTIAEDLLKRKHEILAVIIARRLQHETYDTIAAEEAPLLVAVGAITHAVRKAVVARVCVSALAPKIHSGIKHKTLSRRSRGSITPAVLASRFQSIFNWTSETNEQLVRLATSVLREEGARKGRPNWHKIAEIMERDHGIKLASEQWCRHAHFVMDKTRREQENE